MSLAVLNSRIKKMECENKPIPQKYIDCFNDYIKKIINIRVDQEVEYLNDIIADKFELGKFKSVNELIYAYKSLEKEYTKSRQRIAELEEQLKNATHKFNIGKAIKNIEKSFDKCIVKNEFHSLSDCTKQVRKEVCEEIRNKLKENGLLYTWKGESKYKTMEELLDQIQGE